MSSGRVGPAQQRGRSAVGDAARGRDLATLQLGRRAALVRIAGLTLGTATMWSLGRRAYAHPYHVASAQAEWLPREARMEVALRFIPEDVEAQLSHNHKRRVRLEHDTDASTLLSSLLEREFWLRHGSTQSSFHWVGHEIGAAEAWAYFELRNVPQLDEATVRFSLLVAMESAQANTLTLREGETVHSLLFRAGSLERVIHWP